MKILVIPDAQVKPGIDKIHLECIGKYIVDKLPDVIVNIGDFADMSSLSSHDKPGSKSMEGKRYKADIDATLEAMRVLLKPLRDYQNKLKAHKKKPYKPRMILTLGNHEDRIRRAIDNDPKLDGLISVDDLNYDKDWEVIPFLQPIIIEGVAFCHYFISGVMGRPVTSARALLTKHHMSCIAGHQQGKDIAYGKRGDGTGMTAIIAGSCYTHDEEYLNYQSNNHWRGIYLLHNVRNGQFDECSVPIHYLLEKYK